MNIKSGTMLLSLLRHFEKGHEKELISLLSENDQEILQKCVTPEMFKKDSIVSDETFIQKIHPTWLPFPASKKPNPFANRYFFHYLRQSIEKEEILPIELLPPSPMNDLLEINLERLLALVNLLGIYDLSFEMRRMIDKKLIAQIHNALTSSELNFLPIASKQPIKWIPPKLHLEKWNGDKKALQGLLHKRGLYRLGKGALLEDQSFKWHLCHKMDQARGSYLMKLFAGKEDPAMITFFKGQVLHLIKR